METSSIRTAKIAPAAENRPKTAERAQAQDKPVAAHAKEPVKKTDESSENNSEEKSKSEEKDRRTLAEA
jgi:hypothetical protein